MPLSHLLDTSVFSQPIKAAPNPFVLERWSSRRDDSFCTSAVCLAEVLQGLRWKESPKYWQRYRELLENKYVVLPFDAGTADVFGALSATIRRQGNPRPVIDLMIAATAVRHDLILATLNARDFGGIPGLTVEDWNAAEVP